MINRRRLVPLAAAAALTPAVGFTKQRSDPLRNLIVINSLGDLEDPNQASLDNGPMVTPRIIKDALASGTTALNITLGYVSGDEEPFELSVREIGIWDALVRQNDHKLAKVLTAADIRRAKADGKLGLIYGFQNSAMMGTHADRVDLFADLGMRVIQLTYNPANQLGGGSLAPGDTPLSPFGRKVVERLNAKRVIVDLSHSGQQTCLDAARFSKAPICITHTGCRALVDLPRNKTDEELRLVASKGGYVGIYFMPFLAKDRQITGDDVVDHIEHAIKICGEDHVGVGTDGGTTGIDNMAVWKKAFVDQINRRRAAGISAPGERPDSFTFAIDMNGPEQFRILAHKLAKRGHSERQIEKILGANFLRYAQDIWGA